MINPQGINKSFKDLQLYIHLAYCFITIRILTDHGCNYIANQLLFVFTQTNNVPWFGRNVNESKMWLFCFITEQNHITWILSNSSCPDPAFSSLFFHTPFYFYFLFGIRNYAFQISEILGKHIPIRNCYLMFILLCYGYRLFLSIIPALLTLVSVHQNRWKLLSGPE